MNSTNKNFDSVNLSINTFEFLTRNYYHKFINKENGNNRKKGDIKTKNWKNIVCIKSNINKFLLY